MATAIIFISRYGTVRKATNMLRGLLQDSLIQLIDLRHEPRPDISLYRRIILGGSIHSGHIQKRMKKFCAEYHDILLLKKIGLFICCMEKGLAAKEQFDEAYVADLRKHARVHGLFGGEFIIEKMNLLDRWMVRKMKKITCSIYNLNIESITEFARRMNES
jgi:menaquinone-dependent protoporphyrinogen oxidase